MIIRCINKLEDENKVITGDIERLTETVNKLLKELKNLNDRVEWLELIRKC